MFIQQLTVFLENRTNRLNDILFTLKQNEINVLSLSLADTNEFGLFRLIVDQPEKGANALKENGFSAKLTRVMAVKLPNVVGSLQNMLSLLGEAGLNIEYMYVLANSKDFSAIILKTEHRDQAEALLSEKGYEFVKAEEVERIGA